MLNSLKPDLVWIEGRCYRMDSSETANSFHQEHDTYEVNESEPVYSDCEEFENDYEVTAIDENKYSTSLHVPKPYFGLLIGKRGATKLRLENETKTEIKIPKFGENGDVIIVGQNINNVKTARKRINMILWSSRMKQKATHFVSIPMNNQQIIDNFNNFKQGVLQDCQANGIEESIFILPTKLHITIGVMALMDNEERLHASKLLESAANDIVRPSLKPYHPLRIRVKGISYMNDEPSKIYVLYGDVVEENAPAGVLQTLADDLYKYFTKAGYMQNNFDRDDVKLHVTIMKCSYRGKSQSGGLDSGDMRRTRKQPFDGSKILEKFKDYDFGVMELENIYLSQMGSTLGEDGYYQNTCVVSCAP